MESERDLPLSVFKPHVQTYAIVYCSTGQYELLGHGFLSIYTDDDQNQRVHYLQVESVQNGEVLLRSRMRLRNNYEKQRGSIIAWMDVDQKEHQDLAISFEGDRQCDVIWRLICEKIGKNYLEISGRQTLNLPTENNLPYILDKIKTCKDMVEYNLLNNPPFTNALVSVFQTFKDKKDKMGMGMMGRIIKCLFANIDYRMVQAVFKDPVFQLLLEVQKFLQDVDFPKLWSENLKIRCIVPLNQELTIKVHLIHRIHFYRQNILDLKVENQLQNILILTQQQFSQDIILYLTKQNTIQELIKSTYQSLQQKQIVNHDIAEEETFQSEGLQIKNREFGQKKIQFMLEAIIISKQMNSQNIKVKFFEKIIKSGFMELATDFLDKGTPKALDFFNCFAQLSPHKFFDYLKTRYRESPSDNLHTKLSRKYCLGNQKFQTPILELIKNLSECFKNKQNLDFFMGTFFATVFGCCKQAKYILNMVSEMQNLIENIQPFFAQAIKHKIFQKLVVYLRNSRQQKHLQIQAIKILKRILLQNADSSWSFRKIFLKQLNQEIIKSGYFDYCMTILLKNIRFNNIVSSSMLENIKIIKEMKRFTAYHQEIQNNYRDCEALQKYISKILEVKEEKPQPAEGKHPYNEEIIQELEQAEEEAYLMSEVQEEPKEEELNQQSQENLVRLRQLRKQIEEQQLRDEQIEITSNPSKKIKPNVEDQIVSISFDLPFDEQIQEGDK